MAERTRPLGVTILAILAIIGVLFSIYSLVSYVTFSTLIDAPVPLYFILPLVLITVVLLVLYILIAYGFWKGLRWSWFLAIILLIIGIIGQIVTVSLLLYMLSWSPISDTFDFFYLSSIVRVAIFLVIYGVVLFYLTRPHVKAYFGIGQLGDIISIVKRSKKIIAVIAAAFVVIAVTLVWGFTPTGEIKILNVSYTPESPQPGDKITFIAEISGGSPFAGASASFQYASYFGGGGSGGGTMTPIGDNKYSYTTHSSYEDNTEIWCMIKAGDKISEEHIIQVGHVERSNITSLAITNVTQTPENPTTATTSVQIKADVSSNVNVSEVEIMHMRFYQHGSGGGSGSTSLIEGNTYNMFLSHSPMGNEGYSVGTKVFYRIAAQDESGNTAVTPTYSFTIS